jgi:hypothetical protein
MRTALRGIFGQEDRENWTVKSFIIPDITRKIK